jgi:alkylated DNA repair dioxygenase AlkB
MTVPITLIKDFVSNPSDSFAILNQELDWVRVLNTPRSEYYCNDFNEPYFYGTPEHGRAYQVQPWNDEIMNIRRDLENYTGSKFEVCFLNRYTDQRDQLGWHSDNSPEMDDARPIGIVSLGVEREIWFKEIGTDNDPSHITKVKLPHGSLCLMHAGMQDTHLHRIPKASFICGARISLTFRGYIKN